MKYKIFTTILACMVLAGIFVALWIGGMIMENSASGTAAFHQTPDYLVILGCRLEGEEPGSCLTERIDTAVEYLNAHPDCIAVASGGQGADEVISEAEAIARALEAQGISPRRILKEDHSTSTLENFLYSKELISQEKKDEPYLIAFVTNDFHVYRSGKMAKAAGFESPIAVSAKSSNMNFYLNFPREILAVAASWLYL